MPGGFFQLWFAVRYVHVASVVVLAGGAVLIAVLCATQSSGEPLLFAVPIAVVYEWIFWSVVGVTAATGVSNLGLKGEGLLGPETGWGTALTIKLSAVIAWLCLSLARTSVVRQLMAPTPSRVNDAAERPVAQDVTRTSRVGLVLGALYGATALTMLVVMWLGLGLAHGRY